MNACLTQILQSLQLLWANTDEIVSKRELTYQVSPWHHTRLLLWLYSQPREIFQACEANRARCTWYIASDLFASIYLEEVGLGKHWKWTRRNSVLVAQGYVTAGIGWADHLPNTLKSPETHVPVLRILIRALHPSLSTPGFTLILLFQTYIDYWIALRVCGKQ